MNSTAFASDELRLLDELEAALLSELDRRSTRQPWRNYPDDPVGYARDVPGVVLTEPQAEILRSLLSPPYMTAVDSGHNLGKTFLAAVAVNWWYDSFDPAVVVTTAPTERDVVDLLWTEVRLQRERAAERLRERGFADYPLDFIGPHAPEMRTGEEHYAKGYTARKGESFQGRHRLRMLFIFDEAEGVEPTYWTTTKTMFKPELGHAWLTIGNPTTTTSASYLETQKVKPDGTPTWRRFRLSALDHPNIAAELADPPQPPPIPSAVSLAQLDAWVSDWCQRIPAAERKPTDFEWRPGSGQWWRPGPIAEPRIFGRRPSQGTYGVWSEAVWDICVAGTSGVPRLEFPAGIYPEIGNDVALFGDDWTTFHVRWGGVSLLHESVNGWDEHQIAGRLKQLCAWACEYANSRRPRGLAPFEPKRVPCKIDDTGVGHSVTTHANGYRFVPIIAARTAIMDEFYPNRRSELWFGTEDRAAEGKIDLHLLPQDVRLKLKSQALAPTWKPDSRGRRVVEEKRLTKEKIGRSPDDMDGLNLAYAASDGGVGAQWVEPKPEGQTQGERQGLFGRPAQQTQRPRTFGR